MSESNPSSAQPAEQRALISRTFDRVQGYANSIQGSIRTVMIVYLAAGGWLWALLFVPFSSFAGWQIAFSLLFALLLLSPGIVIGLFYLGLRSLIAIPSILQDSYEAGKTETVSMGQAVNLKKDMEGTVRITTLLGSLWNLRGIVMGSKEMLVGYVALFRMINVVTLVVTGIALVAGAVETLIALITVFFKAM